MFSLVFVQDDSFPDLLIVCQKVQLVFVDTPHYIYVYIACTVFNMRLHTRIDRLKAAVAVFDVIISTESNITVPDTLSCKYSGSNFEHNTI